MLLCGLPRVTPENITQWRYGKLSVGYGTSQVLETQTLVSLYQRIYA